METAGIAMPTRTTSIGLKIKPNDSATSRLGILRVLRSLQESGRPAKFGSADVELNDEAVLSIVLEEEVVADWILRIE